MPPRGPLLTNLAIIGQGPGEEEAALAKPFVGKSGRMLSYWIAKAGLDESAIHIDNIVRCRLVARDKHNKPTLTASGNMMNRPPSVAEYSYCWASHGLPSLLGVLSKVGPRVIVPCGVPAATVVLGRKAKAGFVGQVFGVQL